MGNGSTGSDAIVLEKEDREQLGVLGVSAESIVAEYDSFCSDGENHSDAVKSVFNSFGTASVNQGVYRRVIAAARKARKKRTNGASQN